MAFSEPDWVRKNIRFPLYRLSKRMHPLFWLVCLGLCCVSIPTSAYIWVKLFGWNGRALIEFVQHTDKPQFLVLAFALTAWSLQLPLFLNGAFLFTRKLAGLPIRKRGTLVEWAIYTAKSKRA